MELQAEGKIRYIGVSTPEHDQNCVIDLMRQGYVDVVQLIYNIFEQEPAAELLPAAEEHNIGVIVRVPFDEGALTGKFSEDTTFPEDDFRANYFAGDRLARTVDRVEKIKSEIDTNAQNLEQVALKFILAQGAISSVIPGMRNVAQAKMNAGVSDSLDLSSDLIAKLRKHAWRRSFWYEGK
jgi:aryl-alcohol dehydrogenase-like predicted oxidoreductase